MKLRLRRRSEENDNQFVRLSKKTVNYLYSLAKSKLVPFRNSKGSWCVNDEDPTNIEFLPLKIVRGSQKSVYYSYNGGFCMEGTFHRHQN